METNDKFLNIDLNDLVHRIKNTDERYACLSKNLQIVYWVLVPIYLALIIRDMIANSPIADIAGSFCFLLGMIIFAFLFNSYHKEYKSVDYAQPTLIMLKKAVRRYQPLHHKLWIAIVAIVLINAGLSLRSTFADFVQIQIVFWSMMIVAVIAGLLWWKVRYKPLRDETLRMIREIE